ncbi:hypothetical protein NC653_001549 [Populus alba x Populus x berolinensis]|uniref:Fungal-type protein kinase domain-containing protein n=1 Tax=Populus alba x Populus x berolinensis TaxID=444605 RepID=A0AAD6RMN8_9ROSI|nr:hypothetical protein NC653_001549 [Populus alba x Populus x berolinensis]
MGLVLLLLTNSNLRVTEEETSEFIYACIWSVLKGCRVPSSRNMQGARKFFKNTATGEAINGLEGLFALSLPRLSRILLDYHAIPVLRQTHDLRKCR